METLNKTNKIKIIYLIQRNVGNKKVRVNKKIKNMNFTWRTDKIKNQNLIKKKIGKIINKIIVSN